MGGRKLGRGLQFLLSDRADSSTPAKPESRDARPAPAETTQAPAPSSPPPQAPAAAEPTTEPSSSLRLDRLDPNPYQPRKTFSDEELASLAASIRESGVLQPILVRPHGDRFQIIAGERRCRAARLAGLEVVPVVERTVDDVEMRLLALVENLQRSDLDPIEKAMSFRELKASTNWTHDKIAKSVGLDRSSVSNYLRLLELDPALRREIRNGRLSMGHARALLAVPQQLRNAIAETVLTEGLSVRATEKLATEQVAADSATNGESTNGKARAGSKKPAWAHEMEQSLLEALGCRAAVSFRAGKGRIVLEIGKREEFDRIFELLMSTVPGSNEAQLLREKLLGR